ncbi:RanBP-type and C3HC4-type zinc finger-containing protein 1 [Trachymyrmex septentrionalis]|uniref:RanBP-type and C3HC4-type zinc finger-containing protein 1 n=1 Tax=Trachymyrmex septentrionalis TaxID=34720 RepID=A0A195F7B0_9HYME|nr:RanBP-type and C3HC4-type zinc finger-containing protein 1 [Trachymyrmex septentrionalis]
MVQQTAYSNETSASLNGVPNGDRRGRTSGLIDDVVARSAVDGETTSLTRGSGGGSSGRFSLFKWFKRNRDSTVEKRRRTSAGPDDDGVVRPRSSIYSSVESVNTFYSTTTVRSFAFHTGTLGRCNVLSLDILKQAAEVGPFAAGASKVYLGNKENNASSAAAAACTLPINVHSRRQDITARYSLQPTTFSSCGNFLTPGKDLSDSSRRFESARVNGSTRRRVHVKGKRKAPNPPDAVVKIVEVNARETPPRNSNRRKRRAPRPPEKVTVDQSKLVTDGDGMEVEVRKNVDEGQSISNDTLILQGGMLLSKKEVRGSPKAAKNNNSDAEASNATVVLQERAQSPISTLNMPRPWLNFFHRGERQSDDRKRQEAKRKSGLSILTNISELDKEAAAIVQEEQARARASMLLKTSKFAEDFEKRNDVNEELVQDMVTSAIESSSPRRGTRALISKFNAISNITKVTVNANFFAKRDQPGYKFDRDATRNDRFEQIGDWRNQRFSVQQDLGQSVRVDKDISRYFLPQQRSSRNRTESTNTDVKSVDIKITCSKEQNDQLMKDASSRISFLQSQLAANRESESLTAQKDITFPEEKIRSRREIAKETKDKESPSELNNETRRKFLLSRTRNLSENTETALDPFREKAEGEKEFSNIFDEIDRQLRSREFKLIERRPVAESDNVRDKVSGDEAVSSKVAKVLDILVEAEKDGKTRSAIQPERSMQDKGTSHLIDSDQKAKSSKTKLTALNTVEDPITADLKEMLKEMKHSLPKRPKSKKIVSNDVLEKLEKRSPVPTNKTSYIATTRIATTSNDYETDKQKVSSSAQTSGNIRRLNQPSTSAERPSTSGWKHENVLYKTSGKGSVLVKNTFQLIRPRDFAEIEAMKTTKEIYKENAYANVIEPSLYANTHVSPISLKQQPDPTTSKDILQSNHPEEQFNIADESKIMLNNDELTNEDDNSTARNMNTLAINRLLRKLEGAIASGHHQQAAGLAKELARLKIHCSVIRQRSAARLKDQSIKVNMYIEDKLAHQGPIPLQLPTRMTVAELKTKIHTEFEIPTNVQRWIIGKNLADHDEATLVELHAVDGSPVFLYLVAPDSVALHIDNAAQMNKPQSAEEVPEELTQDPPMEVLQTIEEKQETKEADKIISITNEHEQEIAETNMSEDIKIGRYEELISLENWDVIPNSEPIECPICFVTYGPREGVILRDCLHMFCRPCIANTIAYCEEAEVKCPYRDSDYTCESTLQEREIKALVEPKVYQQHLAKSIAQAENNAGNKAFHCKTPDCPGWCIYDDDVNNFLCPVCEANNCLTCQHIVVHTGKNCKQYQQELQLSKETDQESRRTAAMLKEMVDRGEALACPTCAVVLMKKWGCDWLVCSMCKTEICWVTRGPRWGPGGKGDTSGGCRCGENGVKCHPRCNYCH